MERLGTRWKNDNSNAKLEQLELVHVPNLEIGNEMERNEMERNERKQN